MMNEIDIVLAKLKKVGSPVFLFKMVRDVNKFIKHHQFIFPKTIVLDIVYIQITKQVFEVTPKGIFTLSEIPSQANVIKLSRESLLDVYNFVGSEQLAINDLEKLTIILKQLRQSKNIKQYKTILKFVDTSFETNLGMRDIIKIGMTKFN